MQNFLFPFLHGERFDWLQIEITSYCNASCLYCPRTVYCEQWNNQHLSETIWRKITPIFPRTDLVYLQGWGEPLLHPEFFRFVREVREAGSQVGFTTNGMLLDQPKMEFLLDLEVYVVAFSVAGIRRNNIMRRGTKLEQVLNALETLASLREKRGLKYPRLHVAYMLLRPDLEELPEAINLLSSQGVDEVVISTLDFVPSLELQGEILLPKDKKELRQIKSYLKLAVKAGLKAGIAVHYHLPYPWKRRLYCTENVLQAAFIGVKGTVSPCTFTNLPITTSPSFVRQGKLLTYEPLILGDLNRNSWEEIWSSPLYQAFRDSFRRKKFFAPCQECPKLQGETV